MAERRRFDADEVTMALGKAYGLSQMCFGRIGEKPDVDACSEADIRASLRYIAGLLEAACREVVEAPQAARAAVEQAHGVCRVVLSDFSVEYEGRVGKQWNDDISGWALTALVDAIKRADKTVRSADPREKAGAVHAPH